MTPNIAKQTNWQLNGNEKLNIILGDQDIYPELDDFLDEIL